jgi:hypothetical protein
MKAKTKKKKRSDCLDLLCRIVIVLTIAPPPTQRSIPQGRPDKGRVSFRHRRTGARVFHAHSFQLRRSSLGPLYSHTAAQMVVAAKTISASPTVLRFIWALTGFVVGAESGIYATLTIVLTRSNCARLSLQAVASIL